MFQTATVWPWHSGGVLSGRVSCCFSMQLNSSLQLFPWHNHVLTGLDEDQHPYYSRPVTGLYPNDPVIGRLQDLPSGTRKLLDPRPRNDRNLQWSIDWATAYFVDRLDTKNSPDAQETLANICYKANQLASEGHGLHVPYLAFKSLDQALFGGYLKDAVYLMIESLNTDVPGATFAHGHGPDARVRRITIVLNTDGMQQADGCGILAALIHEMIHAYFLVACGPQQEKEVAYGRLGHGLPFLKIVKTIQDLRTCDGRPRLPPLRRPLRRKPFRYHLPEHDAGDDWFRSHCDPASPTTANSDIEKYYRTVCKPLLDFPDSVHASQVFIVNKRDELELVSRGETHSSAASIEFILEEKDREKSTSVLIPKSCLEDFPHVELAIEKAGCRYLKIKMDKIHRDGLMAFLELLQNGSYSPDLGPVAVRSVSQTIPTIKSTRPGSPKYLLTDIQLFILGDKHGFDDICKKALTRITSQSVTHEDPIAVLAEIYSEGEPPSDLRKWAQAFLIHAPRDGSQLSPAPFGLGAGETLSTENEYAQRTEPPNLYKLKTEYAFKEGFLEIVEKYGSLHLDVLKAEDILSKRGIERMMVPTTASTRLLMPALGGAIVPSGGLSLGLGLADLSSAGMALQLPTATTSPALGFTRFHGPSIGRETRSPSVLAWQDGIVLLEHERLLERRDRARERLRALKVQLEIERARRMNGALGFSGILGEEDEDGEGVGSGLGMGELGLGLRDVERETEGGFSGW